MSDIQSKITLRAEGGEQVANEIKKIKDAFDATEEAAKGFQGGDVFDSAIRQPLPPPIQPAPPPPPPPAPPPPAAPEMPQTQPPGFRNNQFFGSGGLQALGNVAGSMGGRRSNMLGMMANPQMAGAIGGALGSAIPGAGTMIGIAAGVAVAGAVKVVNELAENEMQRVQETFASGMAQRLGAMGESVRMTIIEEERRGTPSSMVQSFMGAYSRSGGTHAGLERPYLTALHPERQRVTESTVLNQVSDLMTGFGVEGSVLGRLTGRLTGEGMDPSRAFGEINTAIGLQTHGESRLTEYFSNILNVLEKQLESGVDVGQNTIDHIIGLQATMEAGGMSADALNRTLTAVTANMSGKLDSPEQILKFLNLRREGESVLDTQLRMETTAGQTEWLTDLVRMNRDNPNMAIRRLSGEFGISLHNARGLFTGVESRIDQSGALAEADYVEIARRMGIDRTSLAANDPMLVNAKLAGVDPASAQEQVQGLIARHTGDISTVAADQLSVLRGIEAAMLDVKTGINQFAGRTLGISSGRVMSTGIPISQQQMGFDWMKFARDPMGYAENVAQSSVLQGGATLGAGVNSGLGTSLLNIGGNRVFYGHESAIYQEEDARRRESPPPPPPAPGFEFTSPSWMNPQAGLMFSSNWRSQPALRANPGAVMQNFSTLEGRHRPTSVLNPGGMMQWFSNLRGRHTSVTNPGSISQWFSNLRGQPTSITNPGSMMRYFGGLEGQHVPTSVTNPGSISQWFSNLRGQPTSVTNPGSIAQWFSNLRNRHTPITNPGSIMQSFSDLEGRYVPTEIENPGSVMQNFSSLAGRNYIPPELEEEEIALQQMLEESTPIPIPEMERDIASLVNLPVTTTTPSGVVLPQNPNIQIPDIQTNELLSNRASLFEQPVTTTPSGVVIPQNPRIRTNALQLLNTRASLRGQPVTQGASNFLLPQASRLGLRSSLVNNMLLRERVSMRGRPMTTTPSGLVIPSVSARMAAAPFQTMQTRASMRGQPVTTTPSGAIIPAVSARMAAAPYQTLQTRASMRGQPVTSPAGSLVIPNVSGRMTASQYMLNRSRAAMNRGQPTISASQEGVPLPNPASIPMPEIDPEPVLQPEFEPVMQPVVAAPEIVTPKIPPIPIQIRYEVQETPKPINLFPEIVPPEPLENFPLSVGYDVQEPPITLNPEIALPELEKINLPIDYNVQEPTLTLNPDIKPLETFRINIPVDYSVQDVPVNLSPEIVPPELSNIVVPIAYLPEDHPIELEPSISEVNRMSVNVPIAYNPIDDAPIVLPMPDITPFEQRNVGVPISLIPEIDTTTIEIPRPEIEPLKPIQIPAPVSITPVFQVQPAVISSATDYGATTTPQVSATAGVTGGVQATPTPISATRDYQDALKHLTISTSEYEKRAEGAVALRMNNPMAVRWKQSNMWQGRTSNAERLAFHGEGTSGQYEAFTSPAWGIAAGVRTLDTYNQEKEIKNLRAAIARWAPTEDKNKPEAYYSKIVDDLKRTGQLTTDAEGNVTFDSRNADQMFQIVKSMIGVESGGNWLSDEYIKNAMGMATQDDLTTPLYGPDYLAKPPSTTGKDLIKPSPGTSARLSMPTNPAQRIRGFMMGGAPGGGMGAMDGGGMPFSFSGAEGGDQQNAWKEAIMEWREKTFDLNEKGNWKVGQNFGSMVKFLSESLQVNYAILAALSGLNPNLRELINVNVEGNGVPTDG